MLTMQTMKAAAKALQKCTCVYTLSPAPVHTSTETTVAIAVAIAVTSGTSFRPGSLFKVMSDESCHCCVSSH